MPVPSMSRLDGFLRTIDPRVPDIKPIKGWAREMAQAHLKQAEKDLDAKNFRGAVSSFRLAALYAEVAASRQRVCKIKKGKENVTKR